MATQSDLIARSGNGSEQETVILEYCFEVEQNEKFIELLVTRGITRVCCEEILETAVFFDVVK
jgi:hypothetical protein